ncbi:MAG: D-alanyl-D-alanine carboxypeptidase [Clostridiales bacterium]|jgi:D-alanyl-D-alanine carboxypeptidase (penicillin-binding protein 5/6)|nr:D-alanyl-D-alanine carboxypeptidase [Clostridiales bacterium]
MLNKIFAFRVFAAALALIIASARPAGAEAIHPEAAGAVLMDSKTGRVLWGKNERAPLPMASTTKIMTAVVALENADLADIVTVSGKAAGQPQVKMNLNAGEKIKMEYLMYALMLQSSNDAAVAIAEHVGGNVQAFCAMMTAKARELGAADTIFETPNGLDAGGHHSTAYDMALITRYALENSAFRDIIATPSVTCSSDRQRYDIVNKNRLLTEYRGCIGVKTGFTNSAGHCFVGAADRGGMRLISVVLASGWGSHGKEQKWRDTREILDYGFGNFEYETILEAGADMGIVFVERSRTPSVRARSADGLMLPLSESERASVEIVPEKPGAVRAPVVKDQQLGVAKIFLAGELVKEIPLLAETGAERHDLKTSMEKVLNTWFEMGTNQQVDVVLPEFYLIR